MRWIADPDVACRRPLTAKLRSRHEGVPAVVESRDGERMRLRFEEPALAATPGQAVVLYHDDEVVGGGWIERTLSLDERAA